MTKRRALVFAGVLAATVGPACGGGGEGGAGGESIARPLTSVAVTAFATGGQHGCASLADGRQLCWGANESGQLGDGTNLARATPKLISRAPVTALAAGWAHTCALYADKTVACWGLNNHGQLGDGTVANRSKPTRVVSLADVAAITAGSNHTCALTTSGAVKCWGHSAFGQLGLAGTADVKFATTTVLSGAAQISASGDASFALRTDGTVWATGRNTGGEMANGTTAPRRAFAQIAGLTGVAQVAAGGGYACALVTAGGVVKCWGSNTNGQLGDGTTTRRLSPTAVPGLANATSIAAGVASTYASVSTGGARSWGANFAGQLGDGTTADRASPGPIPGIALEPRFSAGGAHACAKIAGGEMRCWGSNAQGQVGDGASSIPRTSPTSPNFPGAAPPVRAFAAGYGNMCAALDDGLLRCWGGTAAGNLPVVVPLTSQVAEIAIGQGHTCAALADKTMVCWGANKEGQLGQGSTSTTEVMSPIKVPGLSTVEHVAAGGYSTCAGLTGGGVTCWGDNTYGQLGFTTTTTRQLAPRATGLTGVIKLSIGNFGRTTYALLADGTVAAAGQNVYGALGTGSTTPASRPSFAAVPGLGGVTGVAAGGGFACAVVGGGAALKCWGYNSAGQLGYGIPGIQSFSATPLPVSLPQPIVALAAADITTYATLADGTAWSWGGDADNALGDGSDQIRPDSTAPIRISGLTGVARLAGGYWNGCAVDDLGALRCWGSNDLGQLGTNSFVPDTSVPIEPVF